MNSDSHDDQWLGAVYKFPTVLHGRASFSFDINVESLQKALVQALSSLSETPVSKEISIANLEGYLQGKVTFKIGIGNGEGFDLLDSSEIERVLNRIENRGPFDTLDVVLHLHYGIENDRIHKVHEDQYVTRLVFRPGRVELLIHHLKGIRRIDPQDLIELLLGQLNTEMSRARLPEVELEQVSST
jgi:hypothetical protein